MSINVVAVLLCVLVGALALILIATLSQLRATRRSLADARRNFANLEQDSYYNSLVVDSANDGLVVQNMKGIVQWVNPAYCVLQGLPADQIIGRNPLSFCMPPHETPSEAAIAAFRYDPNDPHFHALHLAHNQRGDGELFWNQISVSFRTAPNGEQHAILVCRDVTEQVENEEKLKETTYKLAHSATHDGLTKIPNRAAMLKNCNELLRVAAKQGSRVGMLHIDLDLFKEINDSKGHGAGDAVLVHVADAMRNVARPNDFVARVGGDEFIVVCPDVQGLADLKQIGHEFAKAIQTPVEWNHHIINCTVSIGGAVSQPGSRDPEELIQHSDFALYEVKRNGRRHVATYDEELHQRHTNMVKRGAELSTAVQNGGLEFFFQPVVNWCTNRLLGFETLVRWRHKTEGLLPPGAFLGLVADLGLMAEVDLAAMAAGIDLKLMLREAGYPNKVVSFNASADGLLHPGYVSGLKSLCARNDINPGQVTVEVLETVMFDDQMSASKHADVISALRNHGFLTVLDDFGVGHAGLAHLAQLNLSGVKIDRSLVSEVLNDKASARITATVLDLCADLDLDVISEGVETARIAERICDMGCNIQQGYAIAKPMPYESVLPWIRNFYGIDATQTAIRVGQK